MPEAGNASEIMRESSFCDWQRMIVHDMKNPLSVILANLDLLSRCRLRAREEEFLGSALAACRDLQRLIRGYLRVSALGEGGPALELCVLHLEPFFRRLGGAWLVMGREKGLDLELDLKEAPAVLVADEHLLERLFSNLVLNAVAQVAPGGRIGVRVSIPSAGRVRISVSDDGPGMPETVKRALVGRRPGGETESEAPGEVPGGSREAAGARSAGTGIGLAFCRLACTLHGGALWAEDVPAGGTAVHVELPMNLVPSGSGLLDVPGEQ